MSIGFDPTDTVVRIRDGSGVGAVCSLSEIQRGNCDSGLSQCAMRRFRMRPVVELPDAAMQFDHHPERASSARAVEPCIERLVGMSQKLNVLDVVFHVGDPALYELRWLVGSR